MIFAVVKETLIRPSQATNSVVMVSCNKNIFSPFLALLILTMLTGENWNHPYLSIFLKISMLSSS